MGAHGSDSKSTGDKKTCHTCGKVHNGVCTSKSKVVAAAELKKLKGNQYAGSCQNKARSNKPSNCLICKEPQNMKTKDHMTGEKKCDRTQPSYVILESSY